MRNTNSSLRSQSGCNIYTEAWLPDGELKAVLIIAHGLSEHCHRYRPFIEHFVGLGYGVYALDHEGHGRSEGRRGYIDRFSDYVDVLYQLITEVSVLHPDKKRFLVGHSMGGVIAVNYLLRYQSSLTGCILSGSALDASEVISPSQQRVLGLISFVAPKWALIKLEGEAVSRDPAVVEAYETDPLVFRGKASARLLSEILKGGDNGLKQADKIHLPLLILHGSDDRLASVNGSQLLHQKVSSSDKTLKIYEGLYHEIFLEPERLQVYGDVESWLQRQMAN